MQPDLILGLVRTAAVNSNIKRALPASGKGQKSTFSLAKAATIFIRLREVIHYVFRHWSIDVRHTT